MSSIVGAAGAIAEYVDPDDVSVTSYKSNGAEFCCLLRVPLALNHVEQYLVPGNVM